MKHIYYISGFGADERVFSKIEFGNYPSHFIPWLDPEKDEPLGDYAKRMSCSIQHDNPILVGLSFGGIMSIEIARHISTSKIILISSVKTFRELPWWMKSAGRSKLDKLFPLRSFRFLEPFQNYNLGIETEDELALVREYRAHIGQQYTNWGIHKVLHWKNEWQSNNCIHIHGGRDRIFPIRNIKADYIIPDGGHFMIMNRAQRVTEIILEVLG
jgi:pimeloyl-ACP methyl ester carboxylesterase